MLKTVSEAIEYRRSVRKYLEVELDEEKVKKCIRNATLAPNSSNMQLWEFYHITDKETLKKEASKYLEIFKDHPYIFNLGHGILPETNPEMVENLIKIVKDFK